MLKNISISLLICSVIFTGGSILTVKAEDENVQKKAVSITVAQNVGNKICPVSGEKIGTGMMEPVHYEYQGKIYNFCCAGCIGSFKADPDKYIKIVNEELNSQVKGSTR